MKIPGVHDGLDHGSGPRLRDAGPEVRSQSTPGRVVLTYVGITATWAMASMVILERSGARGARLSWLAAADVIGFIVVTSIVLLHMLRRHLDRIEASGRVLAASERRLRMIFDALADPIYLTDEAGRIVDANPRACESLGHTRAGLMGRSVAEFDAQLTPVQVEEIMGRLRADPDRTLVFESAHRRADGSIYPVELHARAVDWGGEVRYLSTTRDLTGRRRDQAVLRESEERFRAVFDQAGVGIILASPDRGFLVINEALRAMLGLPGGEPPAAGTRRASRPGELDLTDVDLAQLFDGAGPVRAEKQYTRHDGSSIWVDVSVVAIRDAQGRYDYQLAVVQDITDRRRAEEESRLADDRYRLATASGRVVTWEADGDATIRRIDPAFWGWVDGGPAGPPDDLPSWIAWHHPDDRERIAAAIRDAFEGRTPEIVFEFRSPTTEGTTGWFQCRGRVDRGPDGRPLGAAGTIVDITPQKQAEHREKEARARLEAALASMTDAVFVSDAEGRFVEFNEAFATFHKFKGKDDCAKTLSEYTDFLDVRFPDGELAPLDRWAVPRALRGEAVTGAEYTLHRRDTGETWVGSYSFGPIRGEGGAIVGAVVTARDITAQKRAADELRESRERLRLAMEAAGAGVWEWDLATDALSWSDEVWRLYGLEPNSCTPSYETWLAAVHPDDRDRADAEVRSAAAAAAPEISIEWRGHDPRGTECWLMSRGRAVRDTDGRLTRYLGIVVDITGRKRAEEALRFSEEMFAKAFASNPAAIALTRLEDGRFLNVNETWSALTGYGRDEAIGRTPADLRIWWSPAERERFADALRQQGSVDGWEQDFRGKSGENFSTQLCAQVMDLGGEAVILSTFIDITARKRAEAAFRDNQAFQETLLRAIPAPVFFKDTEGRYVEGNDAFFRFLGRERDRVVGHTAHELVPAGLADLYTEMDRRLLAERGLQVHQTQLLSPDGVLNVVFHKTTFDGPDGRPRGIVGVILDVTDRVRAEDAVRALNADLERRVADRTAAVQELAAIIDSSTDFIATATLDGMPRWENRSFREVVGIPAAGEGRPATIAALHPADSAARILQEGIPAAVRDGHWAGETEVLAADGRAIPVSQLILVHHGDDGEVAYISTIMRDITDRKRLERSLRERSNELALANAELVRSSRMKDEFLASMSHELRTPLNGILGFAEGLAEGVYGELGDDQRRCVLDVHECGRHLLDLINDILDVAKIEAGMVELEVAEVAVGPLCESAVRFVKQAAQRKSIPVRLSIDDPVGRVVADQRRLKQVLVNLLSNAVKFTDAGGGVGLEVTYDPSRRVARFAVWDTGIGISPEGLSRLFKPFMQLDSGLDRRYSGTGLGLVLAKRLTELHGGMLEVESEPGRGSRFTIVLPWEPDVRPRPEGRETGGAEAPTGGAGTNPGLAQTRVLIVDDDQAGVRALRDYLEVKGYAVEQAADGEAGIARARSRSPHLILMDIQMPGLDGLEAIRRLRLSPGLQDVPIIALTALAMQGDRERALKAGATDYLSKPVRLSVLQRRIHDLLAAEEGLRGNPRGCETGQTPRMD
ncbi:PAS domain S-box protein [Aquisphaera insulae]|uniref:PAS domain S-box protein n=1 Tax=Aquisphaera insulae TaxID=2712864 RepID=UPI0013EDF6DC|nr:PAS domain S-box protein [Aquisphaera insulae]